MATEQVKQLQCTKCLEVKSILEFRKQAKGKFGVRNPCKVCILELDKEYRKTDSSKNAQKKYRESLKGKISNKRGHIKYRQSEKGKTTEKLYYDITDRNSYFRDYNRNRIHIDICFKIKKRLRIRLLGAIKGNYKNGSAIRDLGCTIPELKSYLEGKFIKGMSWSNHGLHGWHIDHIKPLSSFDFNDRNQFLEACNYKNLQPLWAKDNLQKSNK